MELVETLRRCEEFLRWPFPFGASFSGDSFSREPFSSRPFARATSCGRAFKTPPSKANCRPSRALQPLGSRLLLLLAFPDRVDELIDRREVGVPVDGQD